MSYLALARKWRPKIFSEVIGQAHVVSALTNALNNQRVHHAFLFSGTRGVGKTTLARIFAKALNCESGISAEPCGQCTPCQGIDRGNLIDLIEVDAASRTRVEDTRELLDNVQYTPTQGRFKIYLIDEVHMLSTHSFNALLKTLEEPPEHVKFLLATTNPQKLPATILSRCIQFNLKSVDIALLSTHLESILTAEKIQFEPQALLTLAKSANGSVRDSLSLLDQVIAYCNGNITSGQTRAMLGMIDDQLINQLLDRIITNNTSDVFATIDLMSEKSADYATALDELMSLVHAVSLFQLCPESLQYKGIDTREISLFSDRVGAEELQLLYQIALVGKRDFHYAPDPRSGFEMTVMRMLAFQPRKPVVNHPSDNKPQTIKPACSKSDPSAAPPAPGKSDAPEVSEASAAPLASGTGKPDLQNMGTPQGWRNFIDQSGLTGVKRGLLMNMSPISVDGQVITLALDSSRRTMFSEDRKRKIEQHLKERFSMDILLKVEIKDLSQSAAEKETPARHVEQQRQLEENAVRQAFIGDSNVQNLIDVFDAEIDNDSIRKIKQ